MEIVAWYCCGNVRRNQVDKSLLSNELRFSRVLRVQLHPTGTGMIDESVIRTIFREEIARFIGNALRPNLVEGQRLTIPECMRRYRCRRDVITALIRKGEVTATYKPKGKNGRPQYLIEAVSAERHPLLGGVK